MTDRDHGQDAVSDIRVIMDKIGESFGIGRTGTDRICADPSLGKFSGKGAGHGADRGHAADDEPENQRP